MSTLLSVQAPVGVLVRHAEDVRGVLNPTGEPEGRSALRDPLRSGSRVATSSTRLATHGSSGLSLGIKGEHANSTRGDALSVSYRNKHDASGHRETNAAAGGVDDFETTGLVLSSTLRHDPLEQLTTESPSRPSLPIRCRRRLRIRAS